MMHRTTVGTGLLARVLAVSSSYIILVAGGALSGCSGSTPEAHGTGTGRLGAQSVATAQSTAASPSPTTFIPDGYVATPSGLYHKSCVHTVPQGATVDSAWNVSLNGVAIAQDVPCAYPPLGKAGQTGDGGLPPGISHSFLYTDMPAGPPGWTELVATQTVPSPPSNNDGQVVYYWNGLQSTSNSWLIQPVLQWGDNHINGGQFWAIASWILGGGGYNVTNTIRVTPGDLIAYYIVADHSNAPPPYGIVTYKVIAWDLTTNQSTLLWVGMNIVQATSQAFVIPASLEFWSAPNCGLDVPTAWFGSIFLYSGTMFPLSYNATTYSPGNFANVNQSGSCFYGICSPQDGCDDPHSTFMYY